MALTITMPKLSPTMESGMIVKWHKKIGDRIEAGDVLMEVATDKATVEYQSIDGGWLRKILAQEGSEASVNQPIAVLTESQNESLENYEVPKSPATKLEPQAKENLIVSTATEAEAQPSKKSAKSLQQPEFVPEPPLENYTFEFPRGESLGKVKASPLAKKIAKEKGLDITTIKGSGPGNRVVSSDLEKAQKLVGVGSKEVPSLPPGSYEEISLTPMRKIIGQRLQESKSFIPHFYIRQEVNAEALVSVREQLKNGDIKVSVNDFIVRAVALALRKHPEINCGFNSVNGTIIQFQTIDIAVAVSIDEGLITPIVRHADFKTLTELSSEIKFLAQKAKVGKLSPEEYKGGSFTISNLGMHGIIDFQAIINPPQAAILAVGGIQDVPVVRDGSVKPGKMMNLVLSVDHRVIDGVKAAVFINTLKYYLENPALLIL